MSNAWQFDKTTGLWNPIDIPAEDARNWYVDQGVQIQKDKYYYGSDSKYDHNSEYVPGLWDGLNGFTKERK